ncbi:SAM-dependent methyltransferase [Comamonas serinivorans]|uniref:SAM-dependent methyltransferase n=1 Tax=Comamonas serinivorans TaxID=1082851 RepID=A0A1Y0ENC9_9BURK|nr:class I SAM-dependent methyltransferase [Comamonas serinivorans]ARU04938.1 SAM-dependent methyltransferase [Comamonas serinivorans]
MHALLAAIATLPRPTDAQRFFHGRGGLHADSAAWTLDAFPPAWVLTSYEPADDAQLHVLGDALAARWQQIAPGEPLTWVYQCRPQGKHKAPAHTQLMAGSLPEVHVVSEAGLRFRVNLLRGQNHGLFLDMAHGRQWVRDHVAALAGQPGTRVKVLNLFAYTCAFSVAARAAGARQVMNVDMSQAALATGERNHQLNSALWAAPPSVYPMPAAAGVGGGLQPGQGGVSYLPHDIFKSWGRITRQGPYQLVIVDPPSYQKGSFIASKDYPRLLRRLPSLLAPDGTALLCLNAPEIATQDLLDQVAECAPGLRFEHRVSNPPAFADVDEDRSLRVLVFQWTGDGDGTDA